jgi:type IV pilus assembly protein PilP
MLITPISARHALARLVAVLLAGLVASCASNDLGDLEMYAESVLSRKGGNVEPLPPIKPYERYLYKSGQLNLRDPFMSFAQQARDVGSEVVVDNEEQRAFANEILTHNSEELEGYELDTLRMVGTLEDSETMWAIILDPERMVHRVQVGNYLGRNFGKIINIQEDRLDVREIVQDSQGRYEQREAAIALVAQ